MPVIGKVKHNGRNGRLFLATEDGGALTLHYLVKLGRTVYRTRYENAYFTPDGMELKTMDGRTIGDRKDQIHRYPITESAYNSLKPFGDTRDYTEEASLAMYQAIQKTIEQMESARVRPRNKVQTLTAQKDETTESEEKAAAAR